MSEKPEGENKYISPVIGVVLMVTITVVLAAVIAGFVFGMASNLTAIPYHMNVNTSEKGHVVVFVSNITTNKPLSNVLIGIYCIDNFLIKGPLVSNESGLVDFEISDNFDDHYRVICDYNGVRNSDIVDERSIFIKSDEFFGNFSTAIYAAIIAIIGFYLARDRLKAYWKGLMELIKENDEL